MSLVSIGEFARLSRLSPKALRLYDELGLLLPARVDPDTGYRWYAATQLDQARLVASLRRIGVPLAQIKDILALERGHGRRGDPPPTGPGPRPSTRPGGYWLATSLTVLNGKESAMYEVTIRDMPARSLLCLHPEAAHRTS